MNISWRAGLWVMSSLWVLFFCPLYGVLMYLFGECTRRAIAG